jgi:hypothetical protein
LAFGNSDSDFVANLPAARLYITTRNCKGVAITSPRLLAQRSVPLSSVPLTNLLAPCSLLNIRFASEIRNIFGEMGGLKVRNEISATGLRLKPDKNFLRLDRPFNDAVRSRKASAVGEVLLRVPLAGDNARRTARKILADRRDRR